MSSRRLWTASPLIGCPLNASPSAVQSSRLPVAKRRLSGRPRASGGIVPPMSRPPFGESPFTRKGQTVTTRSITIDKERKRRLMGNSVASTEKDRAASTHDRGTIDRLVRKFDQFQDT